MYLHKHLQYVSRSSGKIWQVLEPLGRGLSKYRQLTQERKSLTCCFKIIQDILCLFFVSNCSFLYLYLEMTQKTLIQSENEVSDQANAHVFPAAESCDCTPANEPM